jgi:hypothetical protein
VSLLTILQFFGFNESYHHSLKELLERYNPLFDLTAEERIEATARRVGLNMPETPQE